LPLTAVRRPEPVADDRPARSQLSILEHLEQFRKRVVYSCLAVCVGILVAFAYINPIVNFVFRPIRSVLPPGSRLVYTQPGEAFSVYLQIAVIAGVVFAAPFIMYQVWRLIAPALYLGKKGFAVPFILLTTIGFVAGALFNHYVVFKLMIAFFGSFSSSQLAFWPRLDDVFGLYTKMLFLMGLVFQMPTIVFFLAKMGLVTWRFLLGQFKYAVLIIFIVAAVITPTGDPFNQTVLALPMIGLYVIGIVIAWLFGPVARKKLDEDVGV
jgi:sec-independent protein translocase protein TatC